MHLNNTPLEPDPARSLRGDMQEMNSERKPRLCVMTKDDGGYGFHLHGEKGKSGQFIRKVEAGSPAEAAGLRAGDRLVAVNGVNVERETHHQVGIFDRQTSARLAGGLRRASRGGQQVALPGRCARPRSRPPRSQIRLPWRSPETKGGTIHFACLVNGFCAGA